MVVKQKRPFYFLALLLLGSGAAVFPESGATAENGGFPNSSFINHFAVAEESLTDLLLDKPASNPFEEAYFTLENKIRELEQEPSTQEKVTTTLTVLLLDLAFELVHLWTLQEFSPEYYFGDPAPTALTASNTRRLADLLLDAVVYRHVPILGTGLFSWLGMYSGHIPTISGNNFYYRLGVTAGLTAIGYRFLSTRTVVKGNSVGSWKQAATFLLDIPGLMLLRATPEHDRGRDWLIATQELDYAKPILQAAAIAVMTLWNLTARFQHRTELEDLKLSLKLAKERLLRSNKDDTWSFESRSELPDGSSDQVQENSAQP